MKGNQSDRTKDVESVSVGAAKTEVTRTETVRAESVSSDDGVEGRIVRIAQTEQIHLELKSFSEDFNFEMEDGSWCHFEFESDDISEDDLRRFHVYDAIAAYYHKVEVTTHVLCTASKREQKIELRCGNNVYRVNLIRIRDEDADDVMKELRQKQEDGTLCRDDLVRLLLTPLMSSSHSVEFRIEQGIRMLQEEAKLLEREDLLRMESIFYAFAMKFVPEERLEYLREVLNMTAFGRIMFGDAIEQGMQKGMQQGMQQGIRQGRAAAEHDYARLTERLIQDNRTSDLLEAAKSDVIRERLYREYGIRGED